MSNPTFRHGPFTMDAADPVEKFRVVELGADGVSLCAADGVPFGAVTESAAPAADRDDNDLVHGLPHCVAVHTAGAAVPLDVATGDTPALGDVVYVAADGKVTTDGTGDPAEVGTVIKTNVTGGRVRVLLTLKGA